MSLDSIESRTMSFRRVPTTLTPGSLSNAPKQLSNAFFKSNDDKYFQIIAEYILGIFLRLIDSTCSVKTAY